ncbi:ATP-binding protein, partial [Escherichia coli]
MATKRIRLPGPPPTEGSGSTPLTIEFLVEQPFLATREHARFVEFAEACAHYRYIGVC